MNIENFATINQASAHSKTSDRYAMIPTSRMLNILADHGFMPAKVQEARTRIEENRGFQKHIVRLRAANTSAIVGEYYPEIVLINSHMGSSSFQLMCGVYRLVCANGMMVGETWGTERVKHTGFADDKAEQAVIRIANALPRVGEAVESFRSIALNDSERMAFASSAIELVKDGDDKYSLDPANVIRPRRWSDKADQSLWGTFNVVQESLIRGGVRRVDANGNRSRTREVRNIDRSVAINRALWMLTEKMAELKTANN